MNSSNDSSSTEEWYELGLRISSCLLCPAGVLSSILTMCTLWRKVRTERKSFFNLMFLCSAFDFCYCLTFPFYVNYDQSTWSHVIATGVCFPASLASDLFALILTAERCFALILPHKKLDTKWKLVVYSLVIISAATLSCLRTYYVFSKELVLDRLPPWFRTYWPEWKLLLSTLTDVILPFVLVVLMSLFSGLTLIIVLKRRKSKRKIFVSQIAVIQIRTMATNVEEPMSRELQKNLAKTSMVGDGNILQHVEKRKEEKMNSTITLVLLMDAFFMLNQLGYCMCTVVALINGNNDEPKSLFISLIAENMARAFTFYFYVQFSQMMRKEFVDFLKRTKKSRCCFWWKK